MKMKIYYPELDNNFISLSPHEVQTFAFQNSESQLKNAPDLLGTYE